MSIKVQIPTPMRQHTDGQTTVEVAGTTVKTVLDALAVRYPAITGRLFENGQVRRFVNLYLNDEDVRYLNNMDTPVKDGDELAIIPAVAGG
jgi:molybdopterin synthase sulfur carrier subunit